MGEFMGDFSSSKSNGQKVSGPSSLSSTPQEKPGRRTPRVQWSIHRPPPRLLPISTSTDLDDIRHLTPHFRFVFDARCFGRYAARGLYDQKGNTLIRLTRRVHGDENKFERAEGFVPTSLWGRMAKQQRRNKYSLPYCTLKGDLTDTNGNIYRDIFMDEGFGIPLEGNVTATYLRSLFITNSNLPDHLIYYGVHCIS